MALATSMRPSRVFIFMNGHVAHPPAAEQPSPPETPGTIDRPSSTASPVACTAYAWVRGWVCACARSFRELRVGGDLAALLRRYQCVTRSYLETPLKCNVDVHFHISMICFEFDQRTRRDTHVWYLRRHGEDF
mmetsp:Transcript_6125/g.10502  ORF Transcript_6125/g.10502 Transcript_6125/m.10502 type:complete len:133 (-) Transcript_6125:37-435(-)